MARGVTVPSVSSYLAFPSLLAGSSPSPEFSGADAGTFNRFKRKLRAVYFCCTFLKVAFT